MELSPIDQSGTVTVEPLEDCMPVLNGSIH